MAQNSNVGILAAMAVNFEGPIAEEAKKRQIRKPENSVVAIVPPQKGKTRLNFIFYPQLSPSGNIYGIWGMPISHCLPLSATAQQAFGRSIWEYASLYGHGRE